MAVEAAPRVLIADDHAPTRAMIRWAVEQGGFVVVAEAPDAHGAIREFHQSRPDVVLLDIRMPGGGLRAAEVIASGRPEVCVVVLTVSADEEDFFAALSVGASGYLLKGQDPAEIPRALSRVLSGEAAIDGTLAKRLVQEFRTNGTGRRGGRRLPNGARLTPKEREVLSLLMDGRQTRQIAEQLDVADVTVRTHLSNIYRKLNARNRTEAVGLVRTYADDHGEGEGDGEGAAPREPAGEPAGDPGNDPAGETAGDPAGWGVGEAGPVTGEDRRDVSLDQVLTDLSWIAESRTQSERHLAEWVRMARSLGASWTRVGDALGMTRQSAWQRFSSEE
jgi:DNA-binding NarL/FixJ family response regulator